MDASARSLVLLAAGGTGGHLFPAEALSVALVARGLRVELATDERATRYGAAFPADAVHVIPSETVRGRNPLALARTAAILGLGTIKAWTLLGRRKPAAVVGFGGYPTLPPVLAATLRRIPTIIHDSNAVIGRANRLLAPRVTAIATTFPGILDREPSLAAKVTQTGNPIRPAVIVAAALPYVAPAPEARICVLVFGGSQGARVMADVVPDAIARLDPSLRRQLSVVQQARDEDRPRVVATYDRLGVAAEVAPFFVDLPARMAAAHLVISRSGATTVAELAAIGRPSILVPLPGALDQDQLANAAVLRHAGGAILLTQDVFTPDRLAQEIVALATAPGRLAQMAEGAKSAGATDAADRLADLVLEVARLPRIG
jgi:UDP-N-acetylglucosamine--N-acetylmuramyl-(pentapeptide) pyrophosphoryl-undecaprenol N-acetylglucosamine transferase